MKKYIIFLILILILFPKKTNAANYSFYEAEMIDNIYINKLTPDKKTIYYQKARFFRETGTNKFAYCIEPFRFFENQSAYNDTITPPNLTNEQVKEIALLAHFGYGYENHSDKKWYAITQYLIWTVSEPNGQYYFTDTLNGNKIQPYNKEIEEIQNLVQQYKKLPSFANETLNSVLNNSVNILDKNNIISSFSIDESFAKYISIKDNAIVISEETPIGNYTVKLSKNDNYYNTPLLFYQSNNSQNLIETGDYNIYTEFYLNIKDTSVTIKKIDFDNDAPINSGDAELSGATYRLFDNNMQKINDIIISENYEETLKNINYGKYYLQEIKAGIGYQIDNTLYEFEITPEKNKIELVLKNKVIKGQLIIKKYFEQDNDILPEQNIIFNIYNSKGTLYKQVKTNEEGKIEIDLPYGVYKIEQLTTTEGYQKIETFNIIIKSEEVLTYSLIDYKIPVPNTSITYLNIIKKILKRILIVLC